MMKYFKLKPAIERPIVGTYPQSLKMTDNYFIRSKDSIWEVDINSDISPNLNGIQLERLARKTDLLSVVPISPIYGLIVSEEFKKILQGFNLPPHRFFEAKVFDHYGNEILEKYFLFRLLSFQNEWISFRKSEFIVNKFGAEEVERLEIWNVGDLEKLPPDVCMDMHPEIISLIPDFQFDIFYFAKIGGYFTSAGLKDIILSKLSGIRFEPADFIVQKEMAMPG